MFYCFIVLSGLSVRLFCVVHLCKTFLKYSSCQGSCEPKDRRVFDPLECSDPLTMGRQQLRVKIWKMCMRAYRKHPVVFIAEPSRLVLLVKLMETSERWEEGDHTHPPLPAHFCWFSVHSLRFEQKMVAGSVMGNVAWNLKVSNVR